MRGFLLLPVLLLAACSSFDVTRIAPTPYKADIQQGNVVTQEMVAKLRPGMTKSQVRFLLGSPPIADMFHANRWDYVYIYKKRGTVTEERKLTLFFDNDQLTRVAGDVVAAAPEDPQPETARAARTEIVIDRFDPSKPPPPPEEKGFFGRMLEAIGF